MSGCYITGDPYYAIYSHLECPYPSTDTTNNAWRGYFETDTLCQ
jgi:hypothetical protein